MAERAGTQAERDLAKDRLAKLEPHSFGIYYVYPGLAEEFRLPSHVQCRCGEFYPFGKRCQDAAKHREFHERLKQEFPKGTRVYYNRWGYGLNSPATVVHHCALTHAAGGEMWGWIRLQFDHLQNRRTVPAYGVRGLHLSKEPLPREEAGALAQCKYF